MLCLLIQTLGGVAFIMLLWYIAQQHVTLAFIPLCVLFACCVIQPLNPMMTARLVLAYLTLIEVAIWEPMLRVFRVTKRRVGFHWFKFMRRFGITQQPGSGPLVKFANGRIRHEMSFEAVTPQMLPHDEGAESAYVPEAHRILCIHHTGDDEEDVGIFAHPVSAPDAVCCHHKDQNQSDSKHFVLRELIYSIPVCEDYSDYFALYYWFDTAAPLASGTPNKDSVPRFYAVAELKRKLRGLGQHWELRSSRVRFLTSGVADESEPPSWVDVTDDIKSQLGPLVDAHGTLVAPTTPSTDNLTTEDHSLLFEYFFGVSAKVERAILELVFKGTRPETTKTVEIEIHKHSFCLLRLSEIIAAMLGSPPCVRGEETETK